MVHMILRVIATAAFIVALPASPAVAQTQRQLDWCANKDDAFSPALRIEGCSAAIRSGHQLGENLSWAFYNRGIAYTKKGQLDRAIADFDQALKLDPDSTFALNNRGAAYARKGQFDLAVADFNEAIRLDANSATTFNNRGTAYAKMGQYDRAIEDFDQAIRLDPNDVGALNNRRLAKQLIGASAVAEPDARALKARSLAAQAKASEDAGAFNQVSPINQSRGNGADPTAGARIDRSPAEPMKQLNDAATLNKREPAHRMKGNPAVAPTKTAAAPKSRHAVAVKSKARVHHAAARSHRSKSQSGLARLLRKFQFIDFRKTFRIASHRKTKSVNPETMR